MECIVKTVMTREKAFQFIFKDLVARNEKVFAVLKNLFRKKRFFLVPLSYWLIG